MDQRQLQNILEAAMLAAGRPLSIDQLRELFAESERPTAAQVREALQELATQYEDRGIELKEVASGFRIQVRTAVSDYVSRLWQERPPRYSRALLETLALIAYRQPITRGEIEEIRGVGINSNILRTLFERNWIRVVGHREAPGHPELLGTTREFLDYFNLKNLEDLPTLAELRDMDNVGVQLELPEAGETPPATVGAPAQSETPPEAPAAESAAASADEPPARAEATVEAGSVEEEENGDGGQGEAAVKAASLVARGSPD